MSRNKGRFDWVLHIHECLSYSHNDQPLDPPPHHGETNEQREERMAPWRSWWGRYHTFLEARFGYIHDSPHEPGPRARNQLALLLAEGSADSQDEAIAQAIAAAKEVAPDLGPAQPLWHDAKRKTQIQASTVAGVRYARATLKKLAKLEAAANTATTPDSAVPRYVYVRAESIRWHIIEHRRYRILRETKRFVFVSPNPDRRSYGEDWRLHWLADEALGRGTVRLEKAWIGAGVGLGSSVESRLHLYSYSHAGFCLSEDDLTPLPPPGEASHPRARDADQELLGLMPGSWDARTLKKAYREKAKTLHPDAGGDAEEFQALTDAYERLQQRLLTSVT